MSYLMNNQQKLNEVIFANRNKEYGAYAIRSSYGSTILKSISVMLFGLGSMAYLAYYLSNHTPPIDPNLKIGQTIPDTAIYTIHITPPEDKPEPTAQQKKSSTPPSAAPKPMLSATTGTLVKDSVAFEKPVDPQALASVQTSANPVGPGESGDLGGKGEEKTGTVTTSSPAITPTHEIDEPPLFDGGLRALGEFLGRNLRYPDIAVIGGYGGTVYVRFVVDEMGKVTSPVLLNQVGHGMDEEALRVVSIIPKFKSPAKKKGQAVKTYYQVPIKFKPI